MNRLYHKVFLLERLLLILENRRVDVIKLRQKLNRRNDGKIRGI